MKHVALSIVYAATLTPSRESSLNQGAVDFQSQSGIQSGGSRANSLAAAAGIQFVGQRQSFSRRQPSLTVWVYRATLKFMQPEAPREEIEAQTGDARYLPSSGPGAAARERLERLERDALELRAERESFLRVEQELMDLLGCSSRDKIVHAVRNVLNDLVLLKAMLAKKGLDL